MKNKLLLMCMVLLSLFSATAQVPITSTPGNDVWYHIQCANRRGTAGTIWLTAPNPVNGALSIADLTADDNQLWKVVENGAGIALVNKATGSFMNTANANLSAITIVAALPATPLKLVPTSTAVNTTYWLVSNEAVVTNNITVTFPVVFAFTALGSGYAYAPGNYFTASNTAATSGISFVTNKAVLATTIAAANALVLTVTAGVSPGQVPAADLATFQAAIATAQAVYDNVATTDAGFINASFALTAAQTTFTATVITPKLSTPGTDYWYYLQNTRPANSYLSSTGSTLPLKNTAVIPDDTQLWKFVANTNGTADGFALVNKATGEYMTTDVASGTANLPTAAAMPTVNLKFKPSTVLINGSLGYWIENTGATTTFRLHGGVTYVQNYTGSATDNCTWLVIDYAAGQKVILATKIAATKLICTAGLAGTEPGQYNALALTDLQATVDYAQGIYDAPASTSADYIEAMAQLTLVTAATEATLVLPQVSTAVAPVWYYLKGTLADVPYASVVTTSTPNRLSVEAFNNTDVQQWRLEANGATGGYSLVNKLTAQYINADLANNVWIKMIATAPLNALMTINKPFAATAVTPQTKLFGIAGTSTATAFEMLCAGSAPGWVQSTPGGLWQFITPAAVYKIAFLDQLAQAQARFNSSPARGTEFGQVTTALYTALQTTIATQSALNVATMTDADFIAGEAALKAAKNALVPNKDIKTTDPLTANKWFRIISSSTSTYCAGMAISSNGRAEGAKFTFETKDVNSDAQLFRLELSTDSATVVGIVNKATGKYIGVDGTILAAPTAGNTFTFAALNDVFSFNIKPSLIDPASIAVPQAPYLPLNALQAGLAIGNFNGAVGSGSAWKLEYVSNEPIADYTPQYLQARINARTNVTAVASQIGTEFSQYSAASFTAYNDFVTAEEAKTPATMTQAELLSGLLALLNAPTLLVVNTDLTLLGSSAAAPRWFRILSAATAEKASYAVGMAMSSTFRVEGLKFTYEPRDILATAQLFRFELNATQTNVANIVNFAGATSDIVEYVGVDGMVQAASTLDNEFQITQLGTTNSFWIRPTLLNTAVPPVQLSPLHAGATGANIVNYWATEGSASSWRFELFADLNALKNVSAARYQISSNHGVISVKGVENFEVYSVLGQQQNTKAALKSGVYFVKVNDYTQKYILK